MKSELYSIGHGARSSEVFTELLVKYRITHLVDVRSFPYSRYHNQFRRHELEYALAAKNIRYVYMGDLLGGRPSDKSCYADGKVSHALIRTKDFFLQGIGRLKKAYASEAAVAIMCSESKPQECHRHHLIGKCLAEHGILLKHIDEKGEVQNVEF